MWVRGSKMTVSLVPIPTGWPSIKTAYAGITQKLNTMGTKEEKLAAIYYWRQRLTEDAALIAQGQTPATAPADPIA
jgi:hypothetical protein